MPEQAIEKTETTSNTHPCAGCGNSDHEGPHMKDRITGKVIPSRVRDSKICEACPHKPTFVFAKAA